MERALEERQQALCALLKVPRLLSDLQSVYTQRGTIEAEMRAAIKAPKPE